MSTVSPERIALLLRSAVELMNNGGEHWMKGALKNEVYDMETGDTIPGEFRYCSLGAIKHVEGFTPIERRAAEEALAESIFECESDWLEDRFYVLDIGPIAEGIIFQANDDKNTTWEMVKNWFVVAANRVKTA